MGRNVDSMHPFLEFPKPLGTGGGGGGCCSVSQLVCGVGVPGKYVTGVERGTRGVWGGVGRGTWYIFNCTLANAFHRMRGFRVESFSV